MVESRTLIASALCLVAIASFAYAQQDPVTGKPLFKVRGRIFCDTCKVGYETRASYSLEGGEVRLTCFKPTNREKKSLDIGRIFTNSDGNWQTKFEMKDYGSEYCEARLVKSRDPECNIISHRVNSSRLQLAMNITWHQRTRDARDMAFEVKNPRPDCQQIISESAPYNWDDPRLNDSNYF